MNLTPPLYIFTGAAALSMAATAAFFSITGLAALFAGAAIPVIIMGTCIEFSKLISTVWLHKFWKAKHYVVVGILTLMVALSMLITSGGVYGYLTGSHASQEAPNTQSAMISNRYDQQIKVEQDKIARNEKRIQSLDSIVTTSLSQGRRGGTSADRINRRQATERKTIQDEIDAAYKRVDELSAEKMKVDQEKVKSEAKLGAVKYLAKLFGADESNAVMYFTMIMVLLLDPFAIVLVIATQIAYEERNKKTPDVIGYNPMKIEDDYFYNIPPKSDEIDDQKVDELESNEEIENELDLQSNSDASSNDSSSEISGESVDTKGNIDERTDGHIESITDDKVTDFFNDEEVQLIINDAEPDTIDKIGDVVNKNEMSSDNKIKEVIKALESTLPPTQMTEVKKRWLDDNE